MAPREPLTRLEIEAAGYALRASRHLVHPAFGWDDRRQEALLAVWLHRDKVDPERPEHEQRAFLARAALAAIAEAVRRHLAQDGASRNRVGTSAGPRYKQARMVSMDSMQPGERDRVTDLQHAAECPVGEAMVQQALRAIAALPEPLPTVAALSAAGMDQRHIAKQLGVSPSRVGQLHVKLAAKLRRIIGA
jgi:RNA polymerase sigma factor (sigma-70 family)